jgi:uncharacterized protein YcgI (DUF1989 family)
MPAMDVDHVVAPRSGAAWRVEAGQHVRIVDVEGGQTGDLFLVPTDDVDDGMSNGRTFDYGGTISLTAGSVLYSRRSRPLARIVADDVRRHDFLYTPCSREMYEVQYDLHDHPNCFDNLTGGLRPFGVPDTTVTVAFNFFMNSRVDESGRLRIDPPLCRAGDALTILLERDCFVAVTACPASVANGGGGGGPLGVTIGATVG